MEITVKTYPAPPVDYREIMRYSGIGKDAAGLMDLIENCIAEAEKSFSYKVVYGEKIARKLWCAGIIIFGIVLAVI